MAGEEREAKAPYSAVEAGAERTVQLGWGCQGVGLPGSGWDRGAPGESLVWTKIVRLASAPSKEDGTSTLNL